MCIDKHLILHLSLDLSEICRSLMTYANNLDQDEALRFVGPHLRSKLFETQIVCQQIERQENYLAC